MKKILIFIGIIIVIFMGVYLQLTLHSLPKGTILIRWCVDPNPMRKWTIGGFEKQYKNCHVIVDPNADQSAVLTQISGKVAPNVILAATVEQLRYYNKLGIIEDLTPYVKKYNIPIGNIRKALKGFVYVDDKVMGIPENIGSLCLIYNKKIFDEYNVPYPTNDWTWDDMVETARKLTIYEKVHGREVAKLKGLYIQEDPEVFARMYGGSIFSPDGKTCTINSPKSLKGMENWADLKMKYRVLPSVSEAKSMATGAGWGGDLMLLAQGKVAMVLTGRWLMISYRKYKELDLGMVPMPKTPYPCNIIISKSYCIPKISNNKDQTALFLKHVLSKNNQKLIADYADGWPSVGTKEINKICLFNPEHPEDDNNEALIKDLDNVVDKQISPYITSWDFLQIANLEIEKVWLKEITMKEACNNISDRVNKTIQRNIHNPNFL